MIKGDVGHHHPDILDDRWANMAEQTQLWPIVSSAKTPFHEWKLQQTKDELFPKTTRSNYRKQVAQLAIRFILDQCIFLNSLSE